jgi:transposase
MTAPELLDRLKSEEPMDKYVVFMFVVLGYSKSDISKILQISRPTVYSALERSGH